MARVAIFLDAEVGHLEITLGLARHLAHAGHTVTYLSFPAAGHIVRKHGFSFVPILSDSLPDGATSADVARVSDVFVPLIRGMLDGVVKEEAPDVLVTFTLFALEALVFRYRYNLPVVLLRPQCMFQPRREICRNCVLSRLLRLDDGLADLLELVAGVGPVQNFYDIADNALQMPEIVLFPREFWDGADESDSRMHIMNPGNTVDVLPTPMPKECANISRPLIYCSLGSLSYAVDEETVARFFRVVLEAMVALPRYHLILATGNRKTSNFTPQSTNVYVMEWAPQRAILEKAELMITHAGSGGVRECIAAGVPMVAAPLSRDQFECARIVADRGFGVRVDTKTVTAAELTAKIETVMTDRSFRERVQGMRGAFQRTEWPAAVRLIESICAGGRLATQQEVMGSGTGKASD